MQAIDDFLQINLHISEIFRTFAPDFVKSREQTHMINLISKITLPHVAFRNMGQNHNSCNGSDGAHSRAYRLFLFIVAALLLLPSCGRQFSLNSIFLRMISAEQD